MHTYIYIHLYSALCTKIKILAHTYIHTYIHTYMHTCILIFFKINVYIYTYIYTYIHTYIKSAYKPSPNRVMWKNKKYVGFECKAVLGLPKGHHVVTVATNESHAGHTSHLTHVIRWP